MNNFHVNNKASSKGNKYQMCTKVCIGANAFGEDFSQASHGRSQEGASRCDGLYFGSAES
jgi:hypothetical protein